MSKMPDVHKTFVGGWIDTELAALGKREAANRQLSFSEFLAVVIRREVSKAGTQLTLQDVEWISKELEKNVRKRNERKV